MKKKFSLLISTILLAITSFADLPVGQYNLKLEQQDKTCKKSIETFYNKNKSEFIINSLDKLNRSEIELDHFSLKYQRSYDLLPNGLSHSITCPGSAGQDECWIKKYEFKNNDLKITTIDLILGGEEQLKSICKYTKN